MYDSIIKPTYLVNVYWPNKKKEEEKTKIITHVERKKEAKNK